VVSGVAALADALFDGDRTELVTHLFGARDVDAEDLARLKKMIEQKEKELQADQ
jgi:predicted transcriptional regulator